MKILTSLFYNFTWILKPFPDQSSWNSRNLGIPLSAGTHSLPIIVPSLFWKRWRRMHWSMRYTKLAMLKFIHSASQRWKKWRCLGQRMPSIQVEILILGVENKVRKWKLSFWSAEISVFTFIWGPMQSWPFSRNTAKFRKHNYLLSLRNNQRMIVFNVSTDLSVPLLTIFSTPRRRTFHLNMWHPVTKPPSFSSPRGSPVYFTKETFAVSNVVKHRLKNMYILGMRNQDSKVSSLLWTPQ